MDRVRTSKLWGIGGIAVFLIIFGVCVNTALALSGSGTEGDPWRITSLADFDDFAADANYWDDYTRLETDVNLAGRVYERAVIAPDVNSSTGRFDGIMYRGVFDGKEREIVNLTIHNDGNGFVGLFGCIDKEGQVNNLGLKGASVSGSYYVGSLVGVNLGDISGCYSTGKVRGEFSVGGLAGQNGYARGSTGWGSFTDCHSLTDVDGVGGVGGLIGVSGSGSSISGCYSVGDVNGHSEVGGLAGYISETAVSECYSASSVLGHDYVGGLIGQNWGSSSVLNSRSSGDVSGHGIVGGLLGGTDWEGIVSGCNSTGDVNGYTQVGGLVGVNDNGSIWNCYSVGKTSGSEIVGGLAGANEWGGQVLNSYSIGETCGDGFVGGLVGFNWASVSLCYSACDVNGIGPHVGGLVGSNILQAQGAIVGTVSQCVWDLELQTYGVTKSIGDDAGVIIDVIAAGTAQMKMEGTFARVGWDFVNVWDIGENQTYPYLRTVAAGDINKDHITNFLDLCIVAEQWMRDD